MMQHNKVFKVNCIQHVPKNNPPSYSLSVHVCLIWSMILKSSCLLHETISAVPEMREMMALVRLNSVHSERNHIQWSWE